jgi:hypothetical protein
MSVLRDPMGRLRDQIKIHNDRTFTEHRSQDSRLPRCRLEIDVRPSICQLDLVRWILISLIEVHCHQKPYIACTARWQHARSVMRLSFEKTRVIDSVYCVGMLQLEFQIHMVRCYSEIRPLCIQVESKRC